MDNNFNDRTGGRNDNSFGSGFADDSFSSGSFNGTDSFGSNNGFGGNNSFGSNNSFGGNSSYGSDNSFSGNNSFGGNSSYGSDNSYGSNNSFGGNSSYGGDDNYDPNAPLYHPEPMTYDPNAPLYRPENNTPISSYSSSSVSTKKSPVLTITIVAVLLGLAVVLGIVGYKLFFEKKSIKDYFDTSEGQLVLEMLKNKMTGMPNVKEAKLYVEGNDILVYDVTYNFKSISETEKAMRHQTLELSKPSIQQEIKELMNKKEIKTFSEKFILRTSDGEEFFIYTVTL